MLTSSNSEFAHAQEFGIMKQELDEKRAELEKERALFMEAAIKIGKERAILDVRLLNKC